MARIMTDTAGNLMITTLDDDRQYVACNVQVGASFCGELIDVTDLNITTETDIDCGKPENHRPLPGIDGIVP